MSTLLKLKAEVEGTPAPINDSPKALKMFRDLWGLAMAEGRQLEEGIITQLREEIKAVAIENERLDAPSIAKAGRLAQVRWSRSVGTDNVVSRGLDKPGLRGECVI